MKMGVFWNSAAKIIHLFLPVSTWHERVLSWRSGGFGKDVAQVGRGSEEVQYGRHVRVRPAQG